MSHSCLNFIFLYRLLLHITFLLFLFQFNWKRWPKKTPKFGALPTFSMPKRSHDMVRPVACPLKSVVEDKPVTESL